MLNESSIIIRIMIMIMSVMQMGCLRHRQPPQTQLALPQQWQSSSQPQSHLLKPQTAQPSAAMITQQTWWQQLNDDILGQLVQQALAQNYSLAVAKSKIVQARADRQYTQAALWPNIAADTNFQRGLMGYQTNDQVVSILDANINMSWDLDIFGHNRYQRDATQAQLQYSEFARKTAEISIVAELIDHYIDLREMQLQYQYSQNICDLLATLERLTQDLQQAGLTSSQDTMQVKALVHSQSAQNSFYKNKITTTIYRLENLCSVMPGHYYQLLSVKQPLPNVPVGLLVHTPSSVVANRPDIQQAERLLMVKTALTSAAHTLIFPKINLLALFGFEDTSRTSDTVTWSLGGAITLPLLNFGRIEAQINKAKAEQNEAFLLYKKTVLQALYDVEIALGNLHQQTIRENYLQATVHEYNQAASFTVERFRKGIAAFQDVIDAYKLLFQAQSDHVQCRAQQINAWVSLQKAVGAGIH